MISNKALLKACKKLDKELNKQVDIIYAASVIVLWREFGWRKQRIMRRFATSNVVACECADHGLDKSMMQMLEEETGIEMQLSGYDKSYRDLPYLYHEHGTPIEIPSDAQLLYVKQQEMKWLAPMVLAGLCLALYRDEHFGAERLGRFISGVDELRRTYGEKPKRYMELMEQTTNLKREDLRK